MSDEPKRSCSLVPPPDSPLEQATDPSGAPPEATLVYDGDCGFCARTVRHLRWHTGPSLEIVPYQASLERFPDTPAEDFAEAVHLFEANGRKSKGAEAGLRALARLPGWSLPLWLYSKIAPLRRISDWGYRRIAKNRFTISSWTTSLFGGPPLRRGQTLNRRAFEILLSLAAVAELTKSHFFGDQLAPLWTLIASGIATLSLLCGLAPKAGLYLIWLASSFVPQVHEMYGHTGRASDYLSEALFYAALFSAPAWTARRAENCEPSVFGLFLLRFLTLRVLFDWIPWTAGQQFLFPEAVKILPWLSPLLVFGPRRLRLLGATFLCLSQVVFAVQHGPRWENLFVLAMAVPLLDDAIWLHLAPSRLKARWLDRLPLFRSPIHRRPVQVGLSVLITLMLLAIAVVGFLTSHVHLISNVGR